MEAHASVDATSMSLILQLQHEELQHLLKAEKGKKRLGDESDAQVALLAYERELEDSRDILCDRGMAHSILQAVISDGDLVDAFRAAEDVARADRVLAARLEQNIVATDEDSNIFPAKDLNEAFMQRLYRLYGDCPVYERDETDVEEGESSGSRSSRRSKLSVETRTCIACSSEAAAYNTFRAPCSHIYCATCLETLFRLSTSDELLFLPRCCNQGISYTSMKTFLKGSTKRSFGKANIEFLSPDRTYCCQPPCSAFITESTAEKATCKECQTVTCTLCKASAHVGECPSDPATQHVLDLAGQEGWQRCYSCRRLIELSFGSNHITYAFVLRLFYMC